MPQNVRPQSGNTLSRILQQLRTGISTDPTAAITDVEADLNDLATGLGSLAEAVEQHSSWSRLLTHPSTTGLVASLEVQLTTAQAVLGARRELWEVVGGWRAFLDELYGAPCISDERLRLTEQLAEHVGRLRTHASKITVRLACIYASLDVLQNKCACLLASHVRCWPAVTAPFNSRHPRQLTALLLLPFAVPPHRRRRRQLSDRHPRGAEAGRAPQPAGQVVAGRAAPRAAAGAPLR